MDEEFKYLAIKNWELYQPQQMKNGSQIRSWIKTYTDRDGDYEFTQLTCLQRYVLEGCMRMCGRFGKNIPNNPTHIAHMLHVVRRDAAHVPHAVRTLIAHGFLIQTNQEHTLSEERREYKERREENKKQEGEPERRKETRRISDQPDLVSISESTSHPPGLSGQLLTKLDTAVELIYAAYPRKVGKADAKKKIAAALQRLVKGEALMPFPVIEEAAEWLHERLQVFARSPAGQAGEYTPHPATWFHQSRYLDDENEWYAKGNTSGNGVNHGRAISKQVERIQRNRQVIYETLLGHDGQDAGPSSEQVRERTDTSGNLVLEGDSGKEAT